MGAKPGSLGAVKGAGSRTGLPWPESSPTTAIRLNRQRHDGRESRRLPSAQRECRDANLDITRFGDFRRGAGGEPIPRDGQRSRSPARSNWGTFFKLGTKYSERFHCRLHRRPRSRSTRGHGCYGIGISRTLQALHRTRP